ncbi:hypothetical protein JCM21900_000024 [Sporobolomyces salmonicolor]
MDDTTGDKQQDHERPANPAPEPQSPESMVTPGEGSAVVAEEDEDGSVGRKGDQHGHAAAPSSPARPRPHVGSSASASRPVQQQQQQQAFTVLSHGQNPSRPTPTYPPDYKNRFASSASSTQPSYLAGPSYGTSSPSTDSRSLDIPVATASHATSATRFTSTEPEGYPLTASNEAQFQSLQAYYQDRPSLAQTTFQALYSPYPHPAARPTTDAPPAHRASLGYVPPPPAPGAMQYLNAANYRHRSSASRGASGPGISRRVYSHGSNDDGGTASRPATGDSGASGVEEGASSLMDLRGECGVRKVNPAGGEEGESAQSDCRGGRKRASYKLNEDHERGDANEGGPPSSRRRVDPPPDSRAPPPALSLGWANTHPAGIIYVPAIGSSAYYAQHPQLHEGTNSQYWQASSHVPVYQPYDVAPPPAQQAHSRQSSDEAYPSDQEESPRDEVPYSPASASTADARFGASTSPVTSSHSAPRRILPVLLHQLNVPLVSSSGSRGFVASPGSEDGQRGGEGEELGKGKKGKAKGEKKMRTPAAINSYQIECISGVKPFVTKLRYMLANPQEFSDVICWSDDGQSVLVKTGGKSRMAEDVLPRIFNHSNVTSLTPPSFRSDPLASFPKAYGFQALKDATLSLALSHAAPQAQFNPSWSAASATSAPRRSPEEWRAYVHVHSDDDFIAALENEKEVTKKATSKEGAEVESDHEGDVQDVDNWFTRGTVGDIAVMKRLKAKPKGKSRSTSTGESGGGTRKAGKAQVREEQEKEGGLTVKNDSKPQRFAPPQPQQPDSPHSSPSEQQQLPPSARRIIGGVQVPMEGLLQGVGGGGRQPQESLGGSLH